MEEKLLELVRNTLGCFIFISNELPPKMLNVYLHLLHLISIINKVYYIEHYIHDYDRARKCKYVKQQITSENNVDMKL